MTIEEIYVKIKPKMIGWLKSKDIKEENIEDLVQDSFTATFVATQDVNKFKNYWWQQLKWALAASANKWKKEHKQYKGERVSLENYGEEIEVAELSKKDVATEVNHTYGLTDKQLKRKYLRDNGNDSLEQEEIDNKFLDFLETLGETMGNVLYMKYIDNLPAKEIAKKTGLSLATVNIYCGRCRKKLKRLKGGLNE